MESHATKQRRILNAMLMGARLTAEQANHIGNTTEGTRHIRKIRETFPVRKERIEGTVYYQYWIDEAFLINMKKK